MYDDIKFLKNQIKTKNYIELGSEVNEKASSLNEYVATGSDETIGEVEELFPDTIPQIDGSEENEAQKIPHALPLKEQCAQLLTNYVYHYCDLCNYQSSCEKSLLIHTEKIHKNPKPKKKKQKSPAKMP